MGFSSSKQSDLTSSQNHNSKSKRKTRYCEACGNFISGQLVQALNATYHIDCFKCNDCGALCSSTFFTHQLATSEKLDGTEKVDSSTVIPLCEYDYFKRLDLICYCCNTAIRGIYITALDRKYHLEHFSCSTCHNIIPSDKSFYEHDEKIYCEYHYSTLYASKCEECGDSILGQFVETGGGGGTQYWHPECYMVNKSKKLEL